MLLTVGCPNSHVAVPPGPGRWVSRQRTSNSRRVRVASVPRAPSRNWLLKFVVNIWSWRVKMKWNNKKSKSRRKDGKRRRKNADVPCLDICRLQRVKNAGKGAHQKSMETPARIALPRPLSDWGRGYRRNQEVCHRVAVTLERESVKENEWFLLCPSHLSFLHTEETLWEIGDIALDNLGTRVIDCIWAVKPEKTRIVFQNGSPTTNVLDMWYRQWAVMSDRTPKCLWLWKNDEGEKRNKNQTYRESKMDEMKRRERTGEKGKLKYASFIAWG